MKKNIITLILLLSVLSLEAQNNWFVGIENALLSTGLENQNPYGLEKLPAINTYNSSHTLLIGRNLGKGFSLAIEPSYTQLGQNYMDSRSMGDYHRRISLDYLQVPLMLSRSFGQGKMKIQTKAGFYGSYLLKSNFQESSLFSEGNVIGPMISEENSERFTNVDLGFRAGLGTRVDFTEKVALSFYYSVSSSITDVNSESFTYQPGYKLDYRKSRNVASGLHLGLLYNF